MAYPVRGMSCLGGGVYPCHGPASGEGVPLSWSCLGGIPVLDLTGVQPSTRKDLGPEARGTPRKGQWPRDDSPERTWHQRPGVPSPPRKRPGTRGLGVLLPQPPVDKQTEIITFHIRRMRAVTTHMTDMWSDCIFFGVENCNEESELSLKSSQTDCV